MKRLVPFFPVVLFLFIGFYREDSDFYWSKWMVLMILGALFVSISLWRQLHWSASSLLFYSLLSSLKVCMAHLVPQTNYDASVISRFEASTALTSLGMLFGIFFLNEMGNLELAIAVTCLVDAVYVIVQFITGPRIAGTIGAFFDYDAMNACFLAITIPFVFEVFKKNRAWLILPVVAVLLTLVVDHSSTSLGVFCVVMGTLFYRCLEAEPWWLRCLAIITSTSVLVLAMHHFMPHILHDSGRFEVYKTMMTWWFNNCNHWFGTGNGTFIHFGPHIQQITGIQPTQWFLWLHSDWLQIVFEMGYLGMFLSINLFCFLIKYSWNRPYLLSSIMGYASCMVFQFPVHHALLALVGMSIILLALHPKLRREKSCDY